MRNWVLTGMCWMGRSGEMRLECGFTHIYSGENWYMLVDNEKVVI